VELPKNLDKLRDRAFAGCKKLTAITIPEKVTSVTMSAFTGTAIKEITIPKNVSEFHTSHQKAKLMPTFNFSIKFLGFSPTCYNHIVL
jgi:hypothetical protein